MNVLLACMYATPCVFLVSMKQKLVDPLEQDIFQIIVN